jgi:hypothetical protein
MMPASAGDKPAGSPISSRPVMTPILQVGQATALDS